jgi:hypothetical protein
VNIYVSGHLSDKDDLLNSNCLMIRKSFSQKLSHAGICPHLIQNLSGSELIIYALNQDGENNSVMRQKKIAECWFSNLFDSFAKCAGCEIQERIRCERTHNTIKSIFESNIGRFF